MNSILFSHALDTMIWGTSVVLASIWLFSQFLLAKSGARPKAILLLIPITLAFSTFFGLLDFLPWALASLLLLSYYVVFSQTSLGFPRSSVVKLFVTGVLLILICIAAAALILYNIPNMLNFPVKSSAFAVHWNMVELNIFNLVYPLIPFGYLFFIIIGIVAFFIKVGLTILPRERLSLGFVRFFRILRKLFEFGNSEDDDLQKWRLPFGLAILFSIVVSSLLVVITVLPWINPTYRLVSVDGPSYYQWIESMRGLGVNSALSFAFANDRAVFMVLSYALSFFVDPVSLIQFVPALLSIVLSVVSILVLKFVYHFRKAWVYAALISPFSLQVLGLIYSGYFANILAVILVYIYFTLLLSVFRSPSSLGLFGLLGVSLLILFTHSWTWYVFILSLFVFLFWEWRLAVSKNISRDDFKWKTIVIGTTGGVGLVCDLLRGVLTSTSAFTSVFETAQSTLGLPNPGFVLGGLRLTTNFYLGGVFTNWLLIFLSIVGLLFLASFRSEMSRLLISWIFIGCVPLLFASGELVFNRFFFLMPWIVLSSLGLSFLVRIVVSTDKNPRRRILFEFIPVAFVLLVLLNFSLHYVANINIL